MLSRRSNADMRVIELPSAVLADYPINNHFRGGNEEERGKKIGSPVSEVSDAYTTTFF
jgi:hypothetical protein